MLSQKLVFFVFRQIFTMQTEIELDIANPPLSRLVGDVIRISEAKNLEYKLIETLMM
jgi:hypothetical protein